MQHLATDVIGDAASSSSGVRLAVKNLSRRITTITRFSWRVQLSGLPIKNPASPQVNALDISRQDLSKARKAGINACRAPVWRQQQASMAACFLASSTFRSTAGKKQSDKNSRIQNQASALCLKNMRILSVRREAQSNSLPLLKGTIRSRPRDDLHVDLFHAPLNHYDLSHANYAGRTVPSDRSCITLRDAAPVV